MTNAANMKAKRTSSKADASSVFPISRVNEADVRRWITALNNAEDIMEVELEKIFAKLREGLPITSQQILVLHNALNVISGVSAEMSLMVRK